MPLGLSGSRRRRHPARNGLSRRVRLRMAPHADAVRGVHQAIPARLQELVDSSEQRSVCATCGHIHGTSRFWRHEGARAATPARRVPSSIARGRKVPLHACGGGAPRPIWATSAARHGGIGIAAPLGLGTASPNTLDSTRRVMRESSVLRGGKKERLE